MFIVNFHPMRKLFYTWDILYNLLKLRITKKMFFGVFFNMAATTQSKSSHSKDRSVQ